MISCWLNYRDEGAVSVVVCQRTGSSRDLFVLMVVGWSHDAVGSRLGVGASSVEGRTF